MNLNEKSLRSIWNAFAGHFALGFGVASRCPACGEPAATAKTRQVRNRERIYECACGVAFVAEGESHDRC